MIKQESMIPVLVNLNTDKPVARAPGIIYFEHSSLHISSEEEVFLIIPAAYTFAKNWHKAVIFHENSSKMYGIVPLDPFHAYHLK